VRDEGIFIEELRKGMAARGFETAFVGVAAKWERRIERDLRALLARRDGCLPEAAEYADA
jgi:hypothetical protein